MSQSCSSIKPPQSGVDLSYANQAPSQWHEIPPSREYASQDETIILTGGLSLIHDKLLKPVLSSTGGHYIALPNADFAAFQIGKAFGNKAQCNPTYFTVGNLVKYLQKLRDEDGVSTEEIIRKYLFLTAGGCGPCRFGMYVTEYRKALRDAGFDGFRVASFEHNKGIFQAVDTEEQVVDFSPRFFIALVRAVLIGDIINILGYRMRPYELEQGSTDRAMDQCMEVIADAFEHKKSLVKAMYRCRKVFKEVRLDRLQPKPKVMVTGEFWATLTEGDGNYNLHRFLEAEGAECIPQPLMNRLLLSIWEAEYARAQQEGVAKPNAKSIDFSQAKSKLMIHIAKIAIVTHFKLYAKAIGLNGYELPDMDKLGKLGEKYYPIDSNGGEGHLEVAHLIESAKENLSHLVISVKPFGCMPSSSVSDGIQSLVTAHYPSANFLPIETSGEGAANFYSRVQMALFKAKQSAKEEFETLDIPEYIPSKAHDFMYHPQSSKAGTAAMIIDDLTS